MYTPRVESRVRAPKPKYVSATREIIFAPNIIFGLVYLSPTHCTKSHVLERRALFPFRVARVLCRRAK